MELRKIVETLVEIESEIGNETQIVSYIHSNFLPEARRLGNNLIYIEKVGENKPCLML